MAPNLLPKENRSAVECIESFDWIEVTQEVLVADAWVRPLSSWRRLLFFFLGLPPNRGGDGSPTVVPGEHSTHARPESIVPLSVRLRSKPHAPMLLASELAARFDK